MGRITGITYKEKIQLRKCLWQMASWLYKRNKITTGELRGAYREFDCTRWSSEEVEKFLEKATKIIIKKEKG